MLSVGIMGDECDDEVRRDDKSMESKHWHLVHTDGFKTYGYSLVPRRCFAQQPLSIQLITSDSESTNVSFSLITGRLSLLEF